MGIAEPFNVRVGMMMNFMELEDMHVFGFITRDFKTIFHGPF